MPKVEDMAEALGMEVPPGLTEPYPLDESLPFESDKNVSSQSKEQVH